MAREVKRMNPLGSGILNRLLNNRIIKKQLLPKELGRHMYYHCTQEYNNLGEILPEIYEKETCS